MAVSSVTINNPVASGQDRPLALDQPQLVATFSGGTPNYDVLWEWDDSNLFDNANGRRVQENDTGLTTPGTYTKAPSVALDVAAGRTFFFRVTVTDNSGAGTPVASATHQFTYFDPNPATRQYLSHYMNIGVGFDPTDAPAGGWGAGIGGTVGPDGLVRDFRRYLYHPMNTGVGFSTDQPVGGWGEGIGGTVAPDGDTKDFERYLYHDVNVDSTQPCPFLFRLSTTTAEQGASLVLYGQGLVSATSPTADAYGAEVRLYDTPDLGGSFTVMTITDYVAGDTEDSITVTVPGAATSGFVAVVHTTTPSCPGSNFIGLTVVALQPDAQAGWWVEVWDLRNSAKLISFVADVADAVTEHVAGDIGRGHIRLPQEHPDIPDIVDRTAAPQQQRLVKLYQHGRFAYAFVPDDVQDEYDEDGAALSRIFGKGQERLLQWGRCLWKDFPSNPTATRQWLYGSTENLLPWLNGEEDSLLPNGGFEDATTDGWSAVGTATISAQTDTQHSGSYAGRVSAAALNDGLDTEFSAEEGDRVWLDVWVKDGGITFDKTFALELLDSEDTVLASTTVSPATAAWQSLTVNAVAVVTGTHRLRVTQTAGTIEDYWWVDDGAAYAGISGTYDLSGGTTLRLSRTNVLEGLHSVEAVFQGATGGITAYANVQPNQDYTLTLNMTGTAANDVRAAMRLGGVVDSQQITLTGGVDTITLTGTAGPTDTVVRVFIGGESGVQTVHLDSCSLTPGQPAATPGQIVLDVLAGIQARGTLDFVTTSFDGTFDSAGLAWPETLPFEVDPQWTLYDLLDKFQGLGYRMGFWPQDWRGGGDSGWELALYAPGNAGTNYQDVEDGPALLPGTTVETAEPSSAPPLETVVYGEGAAGLWAVATLSASELMSLERREGFINNPAATAQTTVFRAATHRLNVASTRGASFTASLTEDGDPLPYFHFLPLDSLRAHLPSNTSRDHVADQAYKVSAVTTMYGAGGRTLRYQLDMGSYKLHAQRVRDLLLTRMVEREASENYLPGTGSVSSPRSGGGGQEGPTAQLQEGIVALHDHLWADMEPDQLSGDLAGTMPAPQVHGIRGRPVGAAAPNDGDVYVWDSANGVWVPQAQSGSGTGTVFDGKEFIHTPPATAATENDEFNDATNMSGPTNGLDAKWSKHNLGTASWLVMDDTIAPGSLVLDIPASQSVDQAIYQAVPTGDFEVVARIGMFAQSARTMYGLFVVDTSGNGTGLFIDNGDTTMYIREVTAWQNGAGNTALAPSAVGPEAKFGQEYWLYLGWDDTLGQVSCGLSFSDRFIRPYETVARAFDGGTIAYVAIGRIYGNPAAHYFVDSFRNITP